jgi:hypothetical protein
MERFVGGAKPSFHGGPDVASSATPTDESQGNLGQRDGLMVPAFDIIMVKRFILEYVPMRRLNASPRSTKSHCPHLNQSFAETEEKPLFIFQRHFPLVAASETVFV